MEKLVGLIVAACGVLVAAAWFAPHMAARQAEATVLHEASEAARPPADGTPALMRAGAASVRRAADGHYWAQASVDGRAVLFMVDTGATSVALTRDDALRLGLSPQTLSYDVPIRTASGEARAAAVVLRSVSVGGVRVENVEALVAESGLDTSLLGMSYLGRLSRFEATPEALILRR